MNGLVLDGVEFSRAGFRLGPIDLKVAPGTLTAILGPNGAGKTTLLRTIAGFLRPDAGSIRRGGVDLVSTPPERRRIAWVPAGLGLLPHRDVRRNVRYALDLRGRGGGRETAEHWMERLGIASLADRYPSRLSDGERQRVALARAFASEPTLLLLDEPTAALDANAREDLVQVIRELLATERIPAILVAHDASAALALADRVMLLHAGVPWYEGPLEELLEHPVDRFSARFFGYENVWAPQDLEGEADAVRAQLRLACGPEGVAAPSRAFLARASGGDGPVRVRALRAGGRSVVIDARGLTLIGIRPEGVRVPLPGSAVEVEMRTAEFRHLPGASGRASRGASFSSTVARRSEGTGAPSEPG